MSQTKAYFQSYKKNTLTAVGYWHSIFEPEYPDPAWFIDENWHPAEKKMVIAHLLQGQILADWTGQSWCRFRCGETQMGAKDMTDGVYIYPQGLVHYLEIHQVKLPDEFIRHVQQYKPMEINFGLEHCIITHDWWKGQQGWSKKQKSFQAPNDALMAAYAQKLAQNKE